MGRISVRPTHVLCFLLLLATWSSFSHASGGDEPLVIVQDGKYGYIDHTGKILIPPQFIWAEDFWRGLGTVYVCGRYASIDSSGNLLPLRIAAEGRLEPWEKGGKWGFVDSSGTFKVDPQFEKVLPFSQGFAAVRKGDKWGFIDKSGTMVIPATFKSAYYFREGVASAETESGDVLIDAKGKVLASGFHFLELVAEGRVPVTKENWGYLDLQGRIVIPLIYDHASSFSEGLGAVRKDGKWGYVDRDGKVVIPLKFDDAGSFASGLAPAKIGEQSGFINRSGEFVFLLEFRQAAGFLTYDQEDQLFIAPSDVSRFWTSDDKFGYVNTSGEVIWGPAPESPDHVPLLGWDDEDKTKSCEGFPEEIRHRVAGFPKQ